MVTIPRGFSLIELMIALGIAALISVFALPMYQDSMRKTRRGTAEAYLMDLAQRQQQYFTDTRSFASTPTALQDPVPATVAPYYTVTINVPPNARPPSFSITAAAINSQQTDGNLTLDSTGAKTPAGYW